MKCNPAHQKFVPGTSRGPRNAATLLAQMADLERGQRIRALREGLHLTQPTVAERVRVTLRAYQEWEAGGGLHWENAKRLAKVLGTNADYLMSGERTATPDPFPPQPDVTEQLKRIEQALVTVIELLTGRLDPRAVEAASALEELAAGLHDLDEPQTTTADPLPRTGRAASGRSSA